MNSALDHANVIAASTIAPPSAPGPAHPLFLESTPEPAEPETSAASSQGTFVPANDVVETRGRIPGEEPGSQILECVLVPTPRSLGYRNSEDRSASSADQEDESGSDRSSAVVVHKRIKPNQPFTNRVYIPVIVSCFIRLVGVYY
jgi:hypothetical protein